MINTIIETAKANGGITYNVITGDTNPETGYIVSLKGHERRHFGLSPDMILLYIAHHHREFSEDVYLGLWWDSDHAYEMGGWCLDLSIRVMDRNVALKIAETNEQLAIWDCAKKESITLKQTA